MPSTRPRRPAARLLLAPAAALLLLPSGCSASPEGTEATHAATPRPAAATGTPAAPETAPEAAAAAVVLDHLDPGDAEAPLPDAISRALQTDALVLDCPEGVADGRSRFARDWVGVHRVELDAKGPAEWVLNGLHPCLRQQADDHAYWWIYTADPESGALRLLARALQGRRLEVRPSHHAGMADLRMHLVNGRGEPLQLDLASDGRRYVPAGQLQP